MLQMSFKVLYGLVGQYRLYLLLVAFVASIGGTGYLVHTWHKGQQAIKEERLTSEYIQQMKTQQEAYTQELERLSKQAIEQQAELSRVNSELEKKYHESKRNATLAYDNYRKLLNSGWRLRDKAAPSTSGVQVRQPSDGGAPSPSDLGDSTTSGRELSGEATERLLRLSHDADQVVAQLKNAQTYALELHRMCSAIIESK